MLYCGRRMRISLIFHKHGRSLTVIKLVLIACPVLFAFLLINHHILIAPSASVGYRPGDAIRGIGPTDAAAFIRSADPDIRWLSRKDTTEFRALVPRWADAVRLQIDLRKRGNAFAGLTMTTTDGSPWTSILSSSYLDSLDWNRVPTTTELSLWSRPDDPRHRVEKFTSFAEFEQSPPDPARIGLFRMDPLSFTRIDGYRPSTVERKLGHTLRGGHRLHVYAADEDLKVSFLKEDLNKTIGTDGVVLRIGRAVDIGVIPDQWLVTTKVGDDGVSGKSGPRGVPQRVEAVIPDVDPGFYVIDIVAGGDVLLRDFTTTQQYVAFRDTATFAEGPAFGEEDFTPIELTSTSSTIRLIPQHEQGTQVAIINGKNHALRRVKVETVVDNEDGTANIKLQKGDLTIRGKGHFAVKPFLVPPGEARTVDISAAPDLSGIDYLVGAYTATTSTSTGWEKTIPLTHLDVVKKTVTFTIDTPGVVDGSATIGVHRVGARFLRQESLLENVKRQFTRR